MRTDVTTVAHEERRRGARAARLGAHDVLEHAARVDAELELAREALDVQVELARVAQEILELELVLVREEHVVVLPEASLCGGGLRRLGGQLGVLVDVAEREVAEHVAELISEALPER